MPVARPVQTPVLEEKIEKSGRGGGLGWGQKVIRHMPWGALSGFPRGAGSQEGVLGTLWWFPCPSGPIHAIHADTDPIHIHTCQYAWIHANTKYTSQYMQIPADTCRYIQIPTHTCTYMQYPDTPNLKWPYLGNQGAV